MGTSTGSVWRAAFGTLSSTSDAVPTTVDSIFDLASLTKVISTTTMAMRAVDRGRLSLDEPVNRRIPAWRGSDRASVSVRDLLEHSLGTDCPPSVLPGPHEDVPSSRQPSRRCRSNTPRGPASVYSDLGFMLLGFLLEDLYGVPAQRGIRRRRQSSLQWGEIRFLARCLVAVTHRTHRDRSVAGTTPGWRSSR